VARQVGGPTPLPAAHVAALLKKREGAGLGPRPPAAPEGTPAGAAPPVRAPGPVSAGEGTRVVEEALKRIR